MKRMLDGFYFLPIVVQSISLYSQVSLFLRQVPFHLLSEHNFMLPCYCEEGNKLELQRIYK